MRKLILMRAGDELALRAGLFGEAEAFVVDLQHTPAETAADLLKIASALGRRSLARIHPLASGRANSDLDAIMRWAPYGVILPQAGGGSDAQHLGAKLAVREAENGLDDGVTRIFASAADLPMAIFKLGSLAGATRRLAGLIWDAGALAEALGVAADSPVLEPARAKLVYAAAAAGVPAYTRLARSRDWADAARDGFVGALIATDLPA